MGLIDHYNFELLENEAEKLVFDELERQLALFDEDLCRCNDCVVDMATMALNMVKPLYRFSLLGTLYAAQAMADEAYAASVREAVSKAIEKIRLNPSHDWQPATSVSPGEA
ncbi:MAG: late competence development ComFB family protein [Treponema sp.]|jgi:competence protein ComFB|nr:late competence development ComFB family protein [Treponema sp.]